MWSRLLIGIVVLAAMVGAVFAFAAESGEDSPVRAMTVPAVSSTPPPVAPPISPAPRRRRAAPTSAHPSSDPVPTLPGKAARGSAFAIARLREGSRVTLWHSPGRSVVGAVGPETEFGSPVVFSVVKERGDWLGVTTPDLSNGRLGWIRRDPSRVDLDRTKYSLSVDLSARRLSLRYGDGTVGRFLVTVGGPGSETPVGRFGITDALSFDSSPFYGCCALALSGRQTRLPPGWLGGDRIAIHGTPGPVGGAESHGCIRATDITMRTLFRHVPLGAPVFVRQ
jgi:lipoprotein-anchoring transpeptidase ErfK/SrfK